MHTLKTNQDAQLQTEKKGAPTARHFDGMGDGVRERGFSRSWVEPKLRKETLLATARRPSGSMFSFSSALPLSIPSQARGPPLDSKEFQLHAPHEYGNGKTDTGEPSRAEEGKEWGERAYTGWHRFEIKMVECFQPLARPAYPGHLPL
jgi:hypothetical protein